MSFNEECNREEFESWRRENDELSKEEKDWLYENEEDKLEMTDQEWDEMVLRCREALSKKVDMVAIAKQACGI